MPKEHVAASLCADELDIVSGMSEREVYAAHGASAVSWPKHYDHGRGVSHERHDYHCAQHGRNSKRIHGFNRGCHNDAGAKTIQHDDDCFGCVRQGIWILVEELRNRDMPDVRGGPFQSRCDSAASACLHRVSGLEVRGCTESTEAYQYCVPCVPSREAHAGRGSNVLEPMRGGCEMPAGIHSGAQVARVLRCV